MFSQLFCNFGKIIIFVLSPDQRLPDVNGSILKCNIIEILEVSADGNITKINVNESLSGPQTPEKAKQASFVSLDVRKKVLGHFDKNEDKSFVSFCNWWSVTLGK